MKVEVEVAEVRGGRRRVRDMAEVRGGWRSRVRDIAEEGRKESWVEGRRRTRRREEGKNE